jgi:hypothetical protein
MPESVVSTAVGADKYDAATVERGAGNGPAGLDLHNAVRHKLREDCRIDCRAAREDIQNITR